MKKIIKILTAAGPGPHFFNNPSNIESGIRTIIQTIPDHRKPGFS